MNILFCYRNWMNPNNGGVQRVSDTLARYFVENGHNLFYLTLEFNEKDTYQFPAKIYHLPDSNLFAQANFDFYNNLLNEISADIIINHDSSNERTKFWLNTKNHSAKKISLYHTDPLNGLYRNSEFSGKVRSILSKYFPGFIRFLKILKKRKEMRFLIKNSDRLIFLSEEFKKQIYKELKINTSKIETINNPIHLNIKPDFETKKKQVIFVARLELAVKRPDKMLQIWSHLQTKFPDWELIFLGDGPDWMKIEEIAKDLELKSVKFKGFVDPVPYYKESSIICMTSDYEGFGLVLIEAMQFGVVPVTFNNWLSLKDIIKDNETGVLVSSGNMQEYVLKLDQLLSDERLRDRISAQAREHAKNFQIESIGPKWLKLINELEKEAV